MNQQFQKTYEEPIQLKYITERSFPIHIHNHVELLIVFEGSHGISINDCKYVVHAGELAVVFPNSIHSLFKIDDNVLIAPLIVFTPNATKDLMATFANYLPRNPHLHPDPHLFEELKQICLKMYSLPLDSKREFILRGYLYVLLAYIMDDVDLVKRSLIAYRGKSAIVMGCIEYITNNFTSHLTLSSVAKELNISEAHLSSLFGTYFKTNFRAYINSLRINEAQNHLINTDMTITDICYLCGYENQKTFNKAFKDICGMTPNEYRQMQTTFLPISTP